MKIQIASDLHLEFHKEPNEFACSLLSEAKILILAGDTCEARNLSKFTTFFDIITSHYEYVLFLMGNHDFYGSSVEEAEREVHALEKRYSNFH